MADSKNTSLSITLSAIDHATAPIKALNERLDHLTKPVRNLKSQLGELAEKSGLSSVVEGFKGVGDAVKETLFKFLEVGVVIGEVIHLMFELVNEFDDLGKKAERLGVGVDFLAGMRDAAERTGATVEQLDAGMQTFSENVGQARAGTGRMAKFLAMVSQSSGVPMLLNQIKAAKDNAAAFDILADAMAKVTDPAKRAALAQKTVGDAALAPLLARGSKGIAELREHYEKFSGSEEAAAKAAAGVHDKILDVKAATNGIKAKFVEAFSPVLIKLLEDLSNWLAANRDRIGEVVAQFAAKLPDAIDTVIKAVKNIISTLEPFFDSTTKIKIALGLLVAVMVGPLVLAITTLGIALLTTPFGLFLAGIAGIVAALTHLKEIKDWALGDLSGGLERATATARKEGRKATMDELFPKPAWASGPDAPDVAGMLAPTKAETTSSLISALRKAQNTPQVVQVQGPAGGMLERQGLDVKVTVDGPKGTRVKTESTGDGINVLSGLNLWGLAGG